MVSEQLNHVKKKYTKLKINRFNIDFFILPNYFRNNPNKV